MKNNIVFKSVSFLLAAVLLLSVLFSAGGILVLISLELYDGTVEAAYERQTYYTRYSFSVNLVHRYVSLELGGLPEEYLDQYYGSSWLYGTFPKDSFFYSIYDDSGSLVYTSAASIPSGVRCYEIDIGTVNYRCLAGENTDPNATVYRDNFYSSDEDRYEFLNYTKQKVSGYNVHLFLTEEAFTYNSFWTLITQLYAIRHHLFWILAGALLLFIAVVIYLCCAAGRRPGSVEIRPGGLNRLPLDVYTAAGLGIIFLMAAFASYLLDELYYGSLTRLMIYLLLLAGSAACSMAVALLFAWAAQLKTPENYWLKNTVIARIFGLVGRFLRWVGKGIRWCFRALHSLFRLLPVMWQWLLVCGLMVIAPFFCLLLANSYWWYLSDFFAIMFFVTLAADLFVIVYSAYCFGVLMKGTRRMSQGNLQTKIPTRYLLGCFRDFALRLNTLSEAAYIAAEKQTRSERMKTELITNVSHDIKTPLTSIINFVDLLQKPHTEQEQQEYLEVLSRQSAQMKKLIEDLMELSKANTGNITVNLQTVDAVETVNQALGEFSDKLEAAGVTPVFRQPEYPVLMHADGRLVWRVLFNLLSNVVKYAMPGTRLYIDLIRTEGQVILSLKNISRTELDISAEDLLERFVRGDTARSSEGSGLGLNIAKSLVEAQHGQLELHLDGDLFKVALAFPATQA